MTSAFHLAIKVKDLESTQKFYHEILGCTMGRKTDQWMDFNFFGHQLSAHVVSNLPTLDYCGQVDNVKVPIPHFGCILTLNDFSKVINKLQDHKIEFIVKPQTRYSGKKGEQQTMFVLDFSNNALEFKSFKESSNIF